MQRKQQWQQNVFLTWQSAEIPLQSKSTMSSYFQLPSHMDHLTMLAKTKSVLTCVQRNICFLSFSTVISCHCSDHYSELDPRSQASDRHGCFSRLIRFSISPLHSIGRAGSLWFSPRHRYRGCCDISDSEVSDYFRLRGGHCAAVQTLKEDFIACSRNQTSDPTNSRDIVPNGDVAVWSGFHCCCCCCCCI